MLEPHAGEAKEQDQKLGPNTNGQPEPRGTGAHATDPSASASSTSTNNHPPKPIQTGSGRHRRPQLWPHGKIQNLRGDLKTPNGQWTAKQIEPTFIHSNNDFNSIIILLKLDSYCKIIGVENIEQLSVISLTKYNAIKCGGRGGAKIWFCMIRGEEGSGEGSNYIT